MIAPIYIDLSGTIDEFFLSEQETKDLSRYVLSNISDEYMRYWEKNVDNSLHQTKTEYRQAIFTEQPDDFTVVFGMTPRQSQLGLMLEDGASEFDIKEGFSKSNKRVTKLKVNKDGSLKRDKQGRTIGGGWYLTIPFRHATSEAVAESAIFSSRMPKRIEQLVKTVDRPLTNSDLPEGYRDRRIARTGYKHKAAIYEGLHRRDISSTDKEKRGGYFTFRRVSDKSDEKSWQHPGFEALKLMDKSLNELPIDQVVDRAVDEFLTNKFGG